MSAPQEEPILTIYAGKHVDPFDIRNLANAISRAFEAVGGEPLELRYVGEVPIEEVQK